MDSTTDRILAMATEALQELGDVRWNIVNTPNVPPLVSNLDARLETIQMRVDMLKEIKEEQWNDLGQPMCIYAQATLVAITEICDDLNKGIWVMTEDNQVVLRKRVLTSQWKSQRITAHRTTLLTLQYSLAMIIGTANT